MRYAKNKVINLLSALVLLGSVLSGGTAFGESMETADPGTVLLSAAGTAAIPENQWQKTASFPDWKGYTDDTLAMNSMLSFQCWHGQGTLWLNVSEETKSFSLYVNGVPCDTSGMAAGAWAVDISGLSADGVNTVQVSNILPLGLKGAVTVYIPYPVVAEGHGSLEGIRPETLQLISDIIESDVDYGFSGSQLSIVKNGRLIYENVWGQINRYEPEGGIREDGTATDTDTLYDLASVMLTGGYGGYRFFSRDVLDQFTAPKSIDFSQWGLGWWREGDDKRVWYFGTQSASGTFGHQGWTGTLVMIDPSRNLVIVYLTNKINSPVTDPDTNLNRFDGNHFTASTLGFVPQILSIGMDTETDISGQLLDLAADMAAESLKLVPEGADGDHPFVRNARSRIDVLRKWASAAESEEKLKFADMLGSMLPAEP